MPAEGADEPSGCVVNVDPGGERADVAGVNRDIREMNGVREYRHSPPADDLRGHARRGPIDQRGPETQSGPVQPHPQRPDASRERGDSDVVPEEDVAARDEGGRADLLV